MQKVLILLAILTTAASASSIIGGGDFLRNYKYRNALKIEQSVWGFILYPEQVTRENETRYMLRSLSDESRRTQAYTFRMQRRVYPVDPPQVYNGSQLQIALTSHAPTSSIGSRTYYQVTGNFGVDTRAATRKGTTEGGGIVYFSNFDGYCRNIFKVHEEKIIWYYKDNVVMYERDGRKEIRKLPYDAVFNYYGMVEKKSGEPFITEEFGNIAMWDRIDPTPTQSVNNYYRHVYFGYSDGRYSTPEIAYWRGRSFYDGGFEVKRNFPRAIEEFQKAVSNKHVFGLYYLGLCHYFGVGTPTAPELAWRYLNTAAAYQYDSAMALTGYLANDHKMLQAAADQGNANALFFTGRLAEAAGRGHVKAIYKMGMEVLAEGRVLEARGYFEQALKERFAPAVTRIGDLTSTPAIRLKLYQQAAEQGDAEGMFKAGWMLFQRNFNEGRDYFISGAAQGDVRCRLALTLYEAPAGEGTFLFLTGKHKQAFELWGKNGTPADKFAMGLCLYYGLEVEPDQEKGLELMGDYETDMPLARLKEGKKMLANSSRYKEGIVRILEAAQGGNIEAMQLYAKEMNSSEWWGNYLDERIRRDNNNPEGPYWRELPCCTPIESKDDMPVKYRSDLNDVKEINTMYHRYGH